MVAGDKGKGRDRGTGACCESWRGERRGEGRDSGDLGLGLRPGAKSGKDTWGQGQGLKASLKLRKGGWSQVPDRGYLGGVGWDR